MPPSPVKTPSFDGLPDCPLCHGYGELYDWVPMPFGTGNCRMPTGCDCIADQEDAWIAKQEDTQREFDFLENYDGELTEEQLTRYNVLHKLLYGM